MTQDQIAYFSRRVEEERRRAQSCPDPLIAGIHQQMADQYEHALAAAAPPAAAEAGA